MVPHQHGRPERDRQLDMTEDEREAAGSDGGEQGLDSEGEDFPDLPYDGQLDQEHEDQIFSPINSIGNLSVGNSAEFFLEQNKVVQTTQENILLEVQSTRNWDHFDDPLENLPVIGFPVNKMTTSTPRVTLNQALFSHLSMEDLTNGPDIDAETIPDTSFTESLEEVKGNNSQIGGEGSFELWPEHGTPRKGSLIPLADELKNEKYALRQQIHLSLPNPNIIVTKVFPNKAVPKNVNQMMNSDSQEQIQKTTNAHHSSSGKPVVTANNLRYGRGQLNHPIPDVSKVEPRIRFPKENSYKPPKGRGSPQKSIAGSMSPLIFKSPAEIVKEVLLSNSDDPSMPNFTTANAKVPEEFKSPKQATMLVSQLQEDYNRLLTKYAEAENTIDRLRLEAKVNLYADPPKPSHSIQTGVVHQGSKFVTLTIPKVQKAEMGHSPEPLLEPFLNSERHPAESPSTVQNPEKGRGERLAQALATSVKEFQYQVDQFESSIQSGRMSPHEQLQRFCKLRQKQEALERGYLKSREEHQHLQQQGTKLGVFDPNRDIEGEIFRLGMRLEDLKDQIDQAMQSQPSPVPPPVPPLSMALSSLTDPMTQPPTPSAQIPVPAAHTPHPQNSWPALERTAGSSKADVSSISGDSEPEESTPHPEVLPIPIRQKHQKVEGQYSTLLEHYDRFRELPEMILPKSEQDDPSELTPRTNEHQKSPSVDESTPAIRPEPVEMKTDPLAFTPDRLRDWPKLVDATTSPWNQSVSSHSREPERVRASKPELGVSSHSSNARKDKNKHSDLQPQNATTHMKTVSPQERILSPETDSGFIGSECSRFTPAVHSPEHLKSRLVPSRFTRQVVSSNSSLRQSSPETPERKYSQSILPPKVTPVARKQRNNMDLSEARYPEPWVENRASELGHDSSVSPSESENDRRGAVHTSMWPRSKWQTKKFPTSVSPRTSPQRMKAQKVSEGTELGPVHQEAIQALQDEVSRIKEKLEESLRWPRPNSGRATLPTSRQAECEFGRRQRSSILSESPEQFQDVLAHAKKPDDQWQPSSLRARHELEISSDSDHSPPAPRMQSPRPTPAETFIQPLGSQRLGTVTFKGPYTGKEYSVLVPGLSTSRGNQHSTACRNCSPVETRRRSSAGVRSLTDEAFASTTQPCPQCRRERQQSFHGSTPADRTNSASAPADRIPGSPLSNSTTSETRPMFIAGSPFPFVSYVPYSPTILYCLPTSSEAAVSSPESRLYLPTSYSLMQINPKLDVGFQQPRRHRSFSLDATGVDTLNLSLGHAIEAACRLKLTSSRMARSLTADLDHCRGLRKSLLY
ncbi:microtubule organization protein AKNA [Polypterus senegalus]|uniref:microtubule organization protein AKNA n=1 Tax=Polypterus senegalus TaxID=55291 RepID=UPI0019654925|nr:microtubule organization protein AKNA [Polypterus senegalus]